jgi:hypothetical protein
MNVMDRPVILAITENLSQMIFSYEIPMVGRISKQQPTNLINKIALSFILKPQSCLSYFV